MMKPSNQCATQALTTLPPDAISPAVLLDAFRSLQNGRSGQKAIFSQTPSLSINTLHQPNPDTCPDPRFPPNSKPNHAHEHPITPSRITHHITPNALSHLLPPIPHLTTPFFLCVLCAFAVPIKFDINLRDWY
jgi:hypothetical protein